MGEACWMQWRKGGKNLKNFSTTDWKNANSFEIAEVNGKVAVNVSYSKREEECVAD